MPLILKIWLKNVPEYTIIFCRLILILSLIMQFSTGLMVAVSAVGKIRAYQLIMGSLLLLNIPIGFVLIKFIFYVIKFLVEGSSFLACFLNFTVASNLNSFFSLISFPTKSLKKLFFTTV